MRRRDLAVRIVPTLGVLALAAAALQALDWPRFDACFHTDDPALWIPDPELGYAFRPGARVGKKAVTNRLGLRGPVLSERKPPGSLRILTVGDSTAFGLGVQFEEAFAVRAPGRIAELLPERRVEYAIGALPGYSSYQSRVLLERLLPLRPDLVIFYVGARNDLTRGSYYRDSAIPARMRRRAAWWHDVKLLRAGENLADLLYKRLWLPLLDEESRSRVLPHELEANVRAMLRRVREEGGRSLVLVPPWSEELLARRPHLPRYRALLTETARSLGVATVRLQPLFAARDPAEVYRRDRLHFSAEGHRLAADAIVEAALREGLLPRAGSGRMDGAAGPHGAEE